MRYSFLVLASCFSMWSCRPTISDYKATVRSGRTALPIAVEIEELFGDADHFITHYGFDSDTKVWNTEVFFADRYSLTMQVSVAVDYRRNVVQQVGEPTFYITEYTKMDRGPSGQPGMHSREPECGLTISMAQWQRFYESGADLAALGITRSDPVPGFDEYVAAGRRDRVHVSLLAEDD